MIILTKARSVMMAQMVPTDSRIMKRTVPFVENLDGTISYGFDVCRFRDGHKKNVVDKTPCRTAFVVSVPNNVSQLPSKLT
jgi:hypothetical protein